MRPVVQKQNLSFAESAKVLGEKFKELSSPQEKKKYEEMANNDKKRYANEMKEYKSKNPGSIGVNKSKTVGGASSKKTAAKTSTMSEYDSDDSSDA